MSDLQFSSVPHSTANADGAIKGAFEDRGLEGVFKPCPNEGEGVHRWLFHAACRCVEAGLSDDVAEGLIDEAMSRPPNPANEIAAALASARGDRPRRTLTWPALDSSRREAIGGEGPGLLDFMGASPAPISGGLKSRTEDVIDALFPGDPLLCVGRTQRGFRTRPREQWRGVLDCRQFLVPSSMLTEQGRTASGRLSHHTLENTGRRRFLVVEFDQGGLDLHAALLWHLAHFAPLALAVFSGNKSLHGWFYIQGVDESEVLRFMRYAVSLGADRATWTRSQFVRMPAGERSDGQYNSNALPKGFQPASSRRQAVVYFNPEVISE